MDDGCWRANVTAAVQISGGSEWASPRAVPGDDQRLIDDGCRRVHRTLVRTSVQPATNAVSPPVAPTWLIRISVPESGLLELAEGHRTFTAQRFDRTAARRRLYASAMTLAGKRDNEPASYPEIAEAIAQYGSGDRDAIDEDLRQLFRRVVFKVITAHRDDHLRNHGFLGTPRGWRLSPAFDLNPVPTKLDHAIALTEGDHTPDLDLVRQTAGYYRIKPPQAEEIIREVREAVSSWRRYADSVGIHHDETELMAAGAFAVG
jgi:serine/threonine-protein kinase HipA